MKRAASEETRARTAERVARREHRRAVLERITELRAKLRQANQARKVRMKEIVRVCRQQRLGARDRIRAMRKEALRDLAERARAAREAARIECNQRKTEARKAHRSAVDIVRADLAAERQTLGVWQRHASNGAWYDARHIAELTVSS